MLFLGLYALAYGATSGLLFVLTANELVEIAVKAYCLSVGVYLIWFAALSARRDMARVRRT